MEACKRCVVCCFEFILLLLSSVMCFHPQKPAVMGWGTLSSQKMRNKDKNSFQC